MRPLLAAVLCLALLGGCLPEIPVKPQFGTSGLLPTGNIPPEFAAFNNYGPGTNRLLTTQMCVTPYVVEVVKTAPAVPGELVTATGRCEMYVPPFFTPTPGYDYR
jgi:hypothetical protein